MANITEQLSFTPEKLHQLLTFRIGDSATWFPPANPRSKIPRSSISGHLAASALCKTFGTITLNIKTPTSRTHNVRFQAQDTNVARFTDSSSRLAVAHSQVGALIFEPVGQPNSKS